MLQLRRLLILSICTAVLVIACNYSPDSSESDRATPINSELCRLVEHDAGETEICGQPQAVAALSPRVLDPMLALGIQPVAYAEAAYSDNKLLSLDKFDDPGQQIQHLGQKITTQPVNLGHRNTPSLETLVEVKPDLIVAGTGLANALYAKIAPTLLLTNQNGREGWSRRLKIIAQAFNKEEQAKQVVAQYEAKIAQAQTELASVIETYPHVLPLATNDGSIFRVRSYGSDVAALLKEVGFELDSLDGLPQKTETLEISIEALTKLDPDIIFVMAWNNTDVYNPNEAAIRRWEENPLLQNIRAVKEGRIHFVNGQLWGGTRSGPIAYGLMLDQLPDLLLPFVEEDRS